MSNANPVDPKVPTAAGAGGATALVLWLLGRYIFPDAVPEPVEGGIELLVPALVAFGAGWLKRTSARVLAARAAAAPAGD